MDISSWQGLMRPTGIATACCNFLRRRAPTATKRKVFQIPAHAARGRVTPQNWAAAMSTPGSTTSAQPSRSVLKTEGDIDREPPLATSAMNKGRSLFAEVRSIIL